MRKLDCQREIHCRNITEQYSCPPTQAVVLSGSSQLSGIQFDSALRSYLLDSCCSPEILLVRKRGNFFAAQRIIILGELLIAKNMLPVWMVENKTEAVLQHSQLNYPSESLEGSVNEIFSLGSNLASVPIHML